MKKIIVLLLVAFIAIGCVFAEEPDPAKTLKITANISEVAPALELRASLSSSGDFVHQDVEFNSAAFDLTSNDASAPVYFTIFQTNKAKYNKKVTVGVEATPLKLKTVSTWDVNSQTADPVVTAITAGSATDGITVTNSTVTGATASAIFNYPKNTVKANTTVASFSCTWAGSDKLQVGAYEATVTLTCTTE